MQDCILGVQFKDLLKCHDVPLWKVVIGVFAEIVQWKMHALVKTVKLMYFVRKVITVI